MIEIPNILTANTYYWYPGSSASMRRKTEEKRREEVFDFFTKLGMCVVQVGHKVIGKINNLEAIFSYEESCKHVYKSLYVENNGIKSNITSIKKLMKNYELRSE